MAHTIKLYHQYQRLSAFLGLSLRVLGTVFLARFTLDIGTQMVFPFIPQISAGLGLSIVGFSWLLFIRALVGVVGPIFGWLSDHNGRRKVMALGLFCQGLGVLGVAVSWRWGAVLPMILFGLGLAAFMPAQQAYISDQVAYLKRGRALGIVEFSWGLVGVVVLPVIGWLIAAFGWRFPFVVLGLFSLLGAGLVWLGLPPAESRSQTGLSWPEVRAVCVRPNVLAAMSVGLLLFAAGGSFITIWSVWLTADFGLAATALGFVATAIGLSQLSGAGLSSLFIDRLGKQRGSGLALLMGAGAFLWLPFTQGQLVPAIAGLMLVAFFFEFTVVSLIPLYSEQVPSARGTVMALVLLGIAVGGSIGPPLATTLWQHYGLGAVCVTAAICLLLAVGITVRFLQESPAEG